MIRPSPTLGVIFAPPNSLSTSAKLLIKRRH